MLDSFLGMEDLFRIPGAKPTPEWGWVGTDPRKFDSVRTPGATNFMDPHATQGFLRAVTGDLTMTGNQWKAGAGGGTPRLSNFDAQAPINGFAPSDPVFFTPNGDGVTDTVTLKFTVDAEAFVDMVGAVALSWYNDNLRPLARVGSVEVGPQLYKNYVALESYRISEQSDRLTQAQINGEIDSDTLSTKQSALDQRTQALSTTGLSDLVDLIYQSQLAPDNGITVTDADVEAQLAKEVEGVEKRHVMGITVKPIAAEGADATPDRKSVV